MNVNPCKIVCCKLLATNNYYKSYLPAVQRFAERLLLLRFIFKEKSGLRILRRGTYSLNIFIETQKFYYFSVKLLGSAAFTKTLVVNNVLSPQLDP